MIKTISQHLKFMVAALIAVAFLSGCAGTKSPFFTSEAAWQEEGASKALDPERRLATRVVVGRFLMAGGKVRRALAFADALEGFQNPQVIGGTLNLFFQGLANRADLPQDERDLVQYFADKLTVRLDAINLPLSPEKRRVIGVYVMALRERLAEP